MLQFERKRLIASCTRNSFTRFFRWKRRKIDHSRINELTWLFRKNNFLSHRSKKERVLAK